MKSEILVILSAFGVVFTNMVNAYDLAGKLFEVQIPGRSTIDLYFLDTEVVLAIESDYIWMNSYSATGLVPTSVITIGDDDIPSSIELKSATQAQLTRYDNGDVSVVDLTYSVTDFDPSGIFESLFNRSIEEDFSSGVILTASQLNTENFPSTNFLHDEGYVAGSSDFDVNIRDGAISIKKIRQSSGDDPSWEYDIEIISVNELDKDFKISTNIDLAKAVYNTQGGLEIAPYGMLDYWDCYGLDVRVANSGADHYYINIDQWIDEHHQVTHPEGRFNLNLGTDVPNSGTIRLALDNVADESKFYIRYLSGEEDTSNSALWRTAGSFNYNTGVWVINDFRSGNLKDQQDNSLVFDYGSSATFTSLNYSQLTSSNARYNAITLALAGWFNIYDTDEDWKNPEVRFLDFSSSFDDAEEEVEEDPNWVPEGWVYYAWPYAYSFSEGRWHFFNESDTQWRVNLTSGVWGTLDAASGWNYYAWPYSYSFDEGAWHWYNNDTQWVVDLFSSEWATFGSSGN